MKFQKGDTILYSSYGVYKIEEITEKSFGGDQKLYYSLIPVFHGDSAIFIPIDNEMLTAKMRRILSKEEIYDLIRNMPKEKANWIENEQERKAKYKEIIAKGDRRELVRLIKSVYLHGQKLKSTGKKLHVVDERFMKEAERLLYDEFAHVLKIERSQVIPFITQQVDHEEHLDVSNQ